MKPVAWQQRYLDPGFAPGIWQDCNEVSRRILERRTDYELRALVTQADALAAEERAAAQMIELRAENERLRELNERFAKRDLSQIDRMFEMEKEIVRLQAVETKVVKLAEILAEYRNGTRPFPMYGELAVLLRE
jgi:hypothetical protein